VRRILALQTGLALAVAFLLAPFQHVHSAQDHDDHDHATLIHSHFYAPPPEPPVQGGPWFTDSDDDHATAWSLDNFTVVPAAGPFLFLPAGAPLLDLLPPPSFVPVDDVEQRGHDPPDLKNFNPRAPPA